MKLIKWFIEAIKESVEIMNGSAEYIQISERQGSRCFALQGTEKLSDLEKAKAELEILNSCIGGSLELEQERRRRVTVLRVYISKRKKK